MRSLLLILILAVTSFGADFYASTGGSGSTCSIGSPCSLRTALANESVMAPGDTLWIRGGTYVGRYISTLDGGTVRPYPDETVKIDGFATTTLSSGIDASVTSFDVATTVNMYAGMVLTIDDEDMQLGSVDDGNTVSVVRGWNGTAAVTHPGASTVYHKEANILRINGSNTTYRDLEVFSSNTLRDEQAVWAATALGVGIGVFGTDNNIIRNIVHNTSGGVFTGSASEDTLVAENLIYNNGVIDINGIPSGMGIYAENAAGYSRIYRNILVNNYHFNMQTGGDGGGYTGGDHQGNIAANSGSPVGAITRNYLTRAEGENYNIVGNYFFQKHDRASSSAFLAGFGDPMLTLTLSDNYFVGGQISMELLNVTTLNGSNNHFFINVTTFGSVALFYDPALLPASGTFNNNTFHGAQGNDHFGAQGVGYFDFAQYKTNTGFDAASTETNVDMPDLAHVLPLQYETGAAHVVIFATSNPATINVNLSTTGLVHGQAYTIKNAFDRFGSNVSSGTYNSASPTVALTLANMTSVAQPSGEASAPSTTVPDFAALIVEPGELDAPQFIPSVRLSGIKLKGVRL